MSDQTDNTDKITNTFEVITNILSNSVFNYIILIAITLMIFVFIAADNGQAYTYVEIFVFMEMLAQVKDAEGCNKKPDATAAATTGAAPTAPATTAPATTGHFGGSRGGANAVSSAVVDLTEVSDSIKNVGKAVNKLTSDAKYEIEYKKYVKQTYESFKDKYKCSMDDIGVLGAFVFVLHSSYLACYNAIQFVNTGIINCLHIDWFDPRYYIGIMLLYGLFLIAANLSTQMLALIIQLISGDDSLSTSQAYINTIIYSVVSVIVSVFFVYFIVGSIAYVTYLLYGMVNVLSNRGIRLQMLYFFLIIMIPIAFGFSFIS